MLVEGTGKTKILIVYDRPCISAYAENKVVFGPRRDLLLNSFKKAGLPESQLTLVAKSKGESSSDLLAGIKKLVAEHRPNVIVPVGEEPLALITGLDGVFNWHCSIVPATAELDGVKVIPLLSVDYVFKNYGDSAYLTFGAQRIADESLFPGFESIPVRRFHLAPSIGFSIGFLQLIKPGQTIALDLETGRGQINTFGIAISATEAIAIKLTQSDYTPEEWHTLWEEIARVCEDPRILKVAQNGIYETLYLSRYGIRLEGIIHDTMWAMKFLHPELEKGLHNVGRLYTNFPYWKKDGDDWNDVRNWQQHLEYNCKDTTGTFAGYEKQLEALKARKLDTFFYDFIMKFFEPLAEMCSNGLLLDEEKLLVMRADTLRDMQAQEEYINRRMIEATGSPININSPAQLKKALKALGYALPLKTDKTGNAKESSDKKALVKLRRKYPKEELFSVLIERSKLNKAYTSYLNFGYDTRTKKVHYMLDGCATETGRWNSTTDHLGWGFNGQTVPKKIRTLIKAAPGKVLMQLDLSQAESRYVAYESPEPKLMQMLEEKRDVHRYVASHIFKKSESLVNDSERNLGKKSGHAANYGVGPKTFAEACLTEMDIYLEQHEAKRIISGYFEVFPGIYNRQANIKKQVASKRMLRTPMGRERHFYGRVDDSMFREAYAYAPQSTIPDITNSLMLFLYKNFEDTDFLLQIHDALLLQVDAGREGEIAEAARDFKAWHPEIILPGGKLIIPVDIEVGNYWKPMRKI